MATRMQQRRGTAAQWTSADPILEAGELGFESDTNKFKIGDGVNQWSDLEYFINEAAIQVDVSGAIADSEKGAANGVATLDSTGNIPVGQLGNLIDGAPAALNTLNELSAALNDSADFGSVVTGTLSSHDLAIQGAEGNINSLLSRMTTAEGDIGTLETTTGDLTGDLSTLSGNFTDHAADSTNVHGITNTGNLVYTNDSRLSDSRTPTTHAASHGAGASDEVTLAQSQITGLSTALDGKASLSGATFTGTVSGISKSMVGLGNVDNTSDANKPVSTATQSALDLKANLADPTFTGTVNAASLTLSGNLTVNGTTTTVNTASFSVDDPLIYIGEGNNANTVDLGFVGSYNDGTYAHQGLVKDASDSKWKLFKGVTDEPTTTINFSQGSLDTLAVGTLEASTVTLSGTSVATTLASKADKTTSITSKSANYEIASADVNTIIEVSSAATITIPADNSFWPVGQRLEVIQTGTGQATIAGGSGVTVNGAPGTKTRTQWSGATIIKRSSNMFVVLGDLSA